MTVTTATDDRLQQLRQAGAAGMDAVGWHYIEVLAQRTHQQTGTAQTLLREKLERLLQAFEKRLQTAQTATPSTPDSTATASPLGALLQEMAPSQVPPAPLATSSFNTHRESPRVRQFRQQLRQISIQKRVSKAIAQAPQNAGPINSHMLVLRALGLMRDISPDYLNRFMAHVDTLLCLEDAEQKRMASRNSARGAAPRKAAASGKAKNKA